MTTHKSGIGKIAFPDLSYASANKRSLHKLDSSNIQKILVFLNSEAMEWAS